MTTSSYNDFPQRQGWQFGPPLATAPATPPVLSPQERIAQAAQLFTRLRGVPAAQRDVYRQHGINTREAWCVNFVSAVCATAGLRPPGGAHVNNIPEIGRRVTAQNIQPGDIAVNSQHTGVVLNVHRDGSGRPIAYDFLNGNTVEGGRWTVGIQRIALNNNPYSLYRHNGDPSRVAPPAAFAQTGNHTASVFSSNLNERRPLIGPAVAYNAPMHTRPQPEQPASKAWNLPRAGA